MIGLCAQYLQLLDQLIFLAKQSLFSSESLPQLDFGAPMGRQFALVARNRAALGAAKEGVPRRVRAATQINYGHVVSLP
jgi:hypothetical protein